LKTLIRIQVSVTGMAMIAGLGGWRGLFKGSTNKQTNTRTHNL